MSKVAFLFPGQGSQSIGMLHDLSQTYSVVLETFQEVSDALDYDVWDLIQNGPEAKLNQTEYTQVAMLTSDVAVYRILQSFDVACAGMMAGHSLGEYAALTCADAMTLTDAARLVERRGALMQQNVPMGKGAMAAIVGLEDKDVETICQEASTPAEKVTPANYNAIGQVVVAGETNAVARAISLAEKKQARLAKMIPVSVPCHCDLLRDAADEFRYVLEEVPFSPPKIPVVSNVDLSIYQSAEQIRNLLKQQLYAPVRWVEIIQLMNRSGIELTVECGPGRVLTGLSKRIERTIRAHYTQDGLGVQTVVDVLNHIKGGGTA